MILRGLLARDAVPDARRYFRAITAAIDVPWDIAVGADLAFPEVPGKRPAKVRLVNAYMPRLHAAAAHDQALAASLIRVIGLKDRPEGLLRPDHVLRVLRGNMANRRRPTRPPADQAPAATPASARRNQRGNRQRAGPEGMSELAAHRQERRFSWKRVPGSRRITRGDVEAVLNAFGGGGRAVLLHSETAEGAQADFLGTHGSIRPFAGSPWDGAHFCAEELGGRQGLRGCTTLCGQGA